MHILPNPFKVLVVLSSSLLYIRTVAQSDTLSLTILVDLNLRPPLASMASASACKHQDKEKKTEKADKEKKTEKAEEKCLNIDEKKQSEQWEFKII